MLVYIDILQRDNEKPRLAGKQVEASLITDKRALIPHSQVYEAYHRSGGADLNTFEPESGGGSPRSMPGSENGTVQTPEL